MNFLNDSENESVENKLKILTTEELTKSEILVAAASKSTVINTACTKTATELWFINYILNLSGSSIEDIEIIKSNTKFKFGDGRRVTAIKRVIFPAVVAGKHCKILLKNC